MRGHLFFAVIRHTSKTVIDDSFSAPHYRYFGVISEGRGIYFSCYICHQTRGFSSSLHSLTVRQ
jgi:hypothetical protein